MRPLTSGLRGGALFAILAALPVAVPAAATLVPAGLEQPIGPASSCNGSDPDLAAVPGGFASVWSEGDHLAFRRLTPNGVALGGVETLAAGAVAAPEVEALPSGGIAVAWYDRGRQRVFGRRTAPDGALGPELELGFAANSQSGFQGLDLAVTADGSAVVAWTTNGAVLLREMRSHSAAHGAAPYEVEAYGGVTGFDPVTLDPVVLPSPDGRLRVFWIASSLFGGHFDERGAIDGKVLQPTAEGYTVAKVLGPLDYGADLEGAMAPDGSYLLVWWYLYDIIDPPVADPGPFVGAQVFSAGDVPGSQVRVDDGNATWESVGAPAAVALPGGGWTVAWHAEAIGEPLALPRVFARDLNADATVLGDPLPLAGSTLRGGARPDLAVAGGGGLLAVWEQLDPPPLTPACLGGQIVARPFALGCGAPGAFCVDDGRFRVALVYRDPRRGLAGNGNGVALSRDSGYFWFFAHDNVEVVVKVLDGRTTNGHYWVFYGGLTDLGFTLQVTDLVTSRVRTYEHRAGEMASRGITDAFPAAVGAGAEARALRVAALDREAFAGAAEESTLPIVGGAPGAAAAAESGISPCTPPELPVLPGPGLCLQGRRFAVTAEWTDFAGHTGFGQGVTLGDDSGYFWFFDPANVELVVKVLDGRTLNGRFWVFYGALTNVEYDLHVEHVFGDEGGADGVADYHNPLGTFASQGDTNALRPPDDFGCPTVLAPVCGRDGVVYSNECEARYAGWVEVAPFGGCR